MVSEWTGPWRVVSEDRGHVDTVDHIVSRDVCDAHVARMRFYAIKESNVTKRQNIFQELEHQAEFHVANVGGCKKAARGDECLVLVKWMG